MMKLKTIAASVALALSGATMTPAFAAINLDGLQLGGTLGSNTFADPAFDPFNYSIGGVGELFISVVARDASTPSNDRSYVRDLGITSRTFVDALEAGTLGNLAFSFGADSKLTSFLADNSGKSISYLVMAVHNPSGFDPDLFTGRNLGFVTTAAVDAAAVNARQPQGANGFQTTGADVGFRSFVQGVNQKTDGGPVGVTAANKSETFLPGDAGFHDQGGFGRDRTFGFDAEGKGLGSAVDFFFISIDDRDSSVSARPELLGKWMLSASGDLSFAPVPVPAAAWLMGSAVLGLAGAARRRRA